MRLVLERRNGGAAGGHKRAAVKTAQLRTGKRVQLVGELRDREGRSLVGAGSTGFVCEPLEGAEGTWLVTYDETLQTWPTPEAQLRAEPRRRPGAIVAAQLLGTLRLLMRAALLEDGKELETTMAQLEVTLLELVSYLTGHAPQPRFFAQLLSSFQPHCECGDSGVCDACGGVDASCQRCGGCGACPRCPRLADPEGGALLTLLDRVPARGASECPGGPRGHAGAVEAPWQEGKRHALTG